MSTYPIPVSMEARPRSSSPSICLDDDYAEEKKPCPSAEQRLIVAVVRRAVWDFVLYRDCDPTRDAERYGLAVDAAGWLFWDGEESYDEVGRYTFQYICSCLELDPQRVREGILRLGREDIQRLNNNIKDH